MTDEKTSLPGKIVSRPKPRKAQKKRGSKHGSGWLNLGIVAAVLVIMLPIGVASFGYLDTGWPGIVGRAVEGLIMLGVGVTAAFGVYENWQLLRQSRPQGAQSKWKNLVGLPLNILIALLCLSVGGSYCIDITQDLITGPQTLQANVWATKTKTTGGRHRSLHYVLQVVDQQDSREFYVSPTER
ncbi:hypothetical protein KIM372_16720 [Bombiscardovia nodaiensis]|uniref:Uncharacterized protein n=1 Tax=Bombiscardovia nodaiensis TaxID=2932181 RepID=A0ABM8BA28_9BIFI|nr:hypothetical protein KIM372_16720 [Bombiscardovia nodaiensis]